LQSDLAEATVDEGAARAAAEGVSTQQSSPGLDRLNAARSKVRELLKRRLPLLDDEIAYLKAKIGPQMESIGDAATDQLGADLTRFENERAADAAQLKPLERLSKQQQMQYIDGQLAQVDSQFQANPAPADAVGLQARKVALEAQKKSLAAELLSGAKRMAQGDKRWGAENYGPCPTGGANPPTMAWTGCGPTSLAITLNYLFQDDPESFASTGAEELVTPSTTRKFSQSAGARVCGSGTNGQVMASKVSTKWPGYQGRKVSLDQATGMLRDGKMVFFLCKGCTGTKKAGGTHTFSGHFMVLDGVNDDGTSFDVLDPSRADVTSITKAELAKTGGFWAIEPK
jgi:hypothetical protein